MKGNRYLGLFPLLHWYNYCASHLYNLVGLTEILEYDWQNVMKAATTILRSKELTRHFQLIWRPVQFRHQLLTPCCCHAAIRTVVWSIFEVTLSDLWPLTRGQQGSVAGWWHIRSVSPLCVWSTIYRIMAALCRYRIHWMLNLNRHCLLTIAVCLNLVKI